jgi:RecA-family ATPase
MELTGQFSLANVTPSHPRQSGHKFGSSRNDLDRALSALNAIPPDLPRDEWVKVGMSLQAAGGTFDDFDQWSAGADSYNAQDSRAAWKSFKPGKGINAATLFHIARDHGWTDGTQQPAPARVTGPVVPSRKPAPGMSASEVWVRCVAATADHPYIVSKGAAGVPLDSLRVVPAGDPQRIMGESMVGALVVPCMDADGTLSTLQFITPPDVTARLNEKGKPGKLNLPGHPVEGWFTVGTITPSAVIYIVEGVGAAWSCWQATGAAAVACFGSGGMGKVAHELRQRDANARLVVVPDVGKEHDARKIAVDIGAAVAAMPDGETDNFDANDLAQRDGYDVLAQLLEAAQEPSKPEIPEEELHPLVKLVNYDFVPKVPRWTIPGFIGQGATSIAGARGVGKTTIMVPLAMVAAGLHAPNDPLAPKHWRHVIYVTEDVEQAVRILTGIVKHGNLGIDEAAVFERFHLVEAARLPPAKVILAGKNYRERFTRRVGQVEVLPLVVFDTVSANFDFENENENSQVGRAMAMLKQDFSGLPVWLIFHLAKASTGSTDVSSLSARGGGAFEADANQNLYLVDDKGSRRLIRGKTRFEAKWADLQIESYTAQTTAQDEYGDTHNLVLRWGVATPPEQTRLEVKGILEEAEKLVKEKAKKLAESTLRTDVRDAVQTGWQLGRPLNKEDVKAKLGSSRNAVTDCIINLLNEGWLYAVEIPAKERTNSNSKYFLVNLDTPEHEAFLATGELPSAKMVVPEGIKKKQIPSVSTPEGETSDSEAKNDGMGDANHAQ